MWVLHDTGEFHFGTVQTLASKPEVSSLHLFLRGSQLASWYTKSFTASLGRLRAVFRAASSTHSRVSQCFQEAVRKASHPYVSLERTKVPARAN